MRNNTIIMGIARLTILLLFGLLVASCDDTLLNDIRQAALPQEAEIAILVDGFRISHLDQKNLGVWSISASARTISVTIRNVGEASLNVAETAVSLTTPDGGFSTTGLSTSLHLPPGGSEDFSIRFDPDDTIGYHAAVEIASNDPVSPVFRFELQAFGANTAGLVSSTPTHNAIDVPKGTVVSITYSKLLSHTTIHTSPGSANVTITPSIDFEVAVSDSVERTSLEIAPTTDLIPGVQYTIELNRNISGGRILDVDGLEADAVTLSFAVLPLPSEPGADPVPSPGTMINPLSDAGVSLTWPVFPGATSYSLHYKAPGAADWTRYPSTGTVTGRSITIICDESARYDWYVIAYNDSGSTSFPGSSNPWTFYTGHYMPASPTLTSPSNGASNLNPAGVTLRWSESSNAASYSVFYRIDGSPVWTEIKDISTNEYTVTGLAEGETYRWFVRALRGDNYADSSSSRVFSTLVSVKAPDAPSNMTLTLSTVGSGLNERMRVSSTWIDNSSNEDGFHISARAVGQSWPSHDVLPVNTTSYTVDVHPPPRGTQIEARVRSFNTGGVSTWIYSPIVTY